jgi:tetratricopeptide (TPR) repeat protein
VIGALLALAMQINVTVVAPETLVVRQPATVVVRAQVAGSVRPVLRPPSFAPLNGVLSEESTSSQQGTGQSSLVVEHRYLVMAPRAGRFTVAPFEARLGREVARSAALHFVVVSPPALPTPAIVSRPPDDAARGVSFRAMVSPETVYVGQQATYQVGVYLSDDVRYRLRRNPEFVPPELRSILAYDLGAAGQPVSRREYGGQRYEVHVFQRALFPLAPGRLEIPPARLNYSLPLSASFFSREESHQLRSESVPLVVLEPPAQGRPADYAGAVGRFTLRSVLDAAEGRVGDPLLLTIAVSGAGNVNFFPRPQVAVPWGQLVAAGERVRLDSSTYVLRGVKEFDWVITPTRAGEWEVPAIRYAYFDPSTRRYDAALSPALRLRVGPGALASGVDPARGVRAEAPMALRRSLGVPVRRPLSDSPAFWLAMIAAPIPAALLGVARRPRARREPTAARRLEALARGGEGVDAPSLRRAYAEALRARIPSITWATLADRKALVRTLRRSGVTARVATDVEAFLAELDAAVYSPGVTLGSGAAARAVALVRAVDDEARALPVLPRAFVVLLATAGLVATGALAWALDPEAEESFARGVEAYGQQRWASAQRQFARAAEREPRAPAAWANLGTAAWAASDTATAVLGWQRALRLDPLAGDVRERLALTPGFAAGTVADVPAIPLAPAVLVAAACWVLAWLLAAAAAWRRAATLRPWAWGVGALAGVAAAGAWRADGAARADRVVVIRESASLRTVPALGGDPVAAAHVGEVGEITGEQGAWARVRLAENREGWVGSEQVQRLGR